MKRAGPALLLAMLLAAAAAGCGRAGDSFGKASAGAARYPIAGVIRKIDRQKRQITLEHGAVPGFMEAMTMAFPVKEPSVLARLRIGDRVSATLVVDGDRYWIERIAGEPGGRPAIPPAAAPVSRAPAVVTPEVNRGIAVGDPVPDFALTDQTGRAVRLSQWRGEPVAVTFLYTRCPVATACPMTAAKFSKLEALLKQEGFGQLLTITVDPEHDTPAVLAEYAKKAGADAGRWKFLTGDPKAVADVASRFGVLYYPDRGQIVHTQAAAVVDPRGNLASIYYGEDWQPERLLRDMQKARKG